MWVSNFLENGNLSVDSIDIRLILDLVLFQNFYRYFVARYNVRALLHLAESTFPLRFAYNESPYFLTLAVFLLLIAFFAVAIKVRRLWLCSIFGSLFICLLAGSTFILFIDSGILRISLLVAISIGHISTLNRYVIISHLLFVSLMVFSYESDNIIFVS